MKETSTGMVLEVVWNSTIFHFLISDRLKRNIVLGRHVEKPWNSVHLITDTAAKISNEYGLKMVGMNAK